MNPTPPTDLSVRIASELLSLRWVQAGINEHQLATKIDAHLAPLLDDKAALDWLGSMSGAEIAHDRVGNVSLHKVVSSPDGQTSTHLGFGRSLRAAIRAARAGRTG